MQVRLATLHNDWIQHGAAVHLVIALEGEVLQVLANQLLAETNGIIVAEILADGARGASPACLSPATKEHSDGHSSDPKDRVAQPKPAPPNEDAITVAYWDIKHEAA